MPEVVYAFATTGGSTPGASSWQKNQIVDFETSKSTSNTNKGTWQLRDKCINIICVMCSAGSAASGVGKPTFPGDFLRDRAGAHHGFQAHMGNQPTCSLEIGSPFVIKAGCALAFAAGIKTFLWKCPNFWSNHFFGEMTSCGQTKAALCRLLCPNNDSTKSLGPKCRRVGWTNQAWISHNYMSCIIILWSILMPKKNIQLLLKIRWWGSLHGGLLQWQGRSPPSFQPEIQFYINIDGGCFCSWFDLTNLIDNIIQKYIIIYPTARGHSHYSFHPKCCLGSANVKASGSQIRIASSRCCQNLAGHVWENLQYIYYETIYIIDRYSSGLFPY